MQISSFFRSILGSKFGPIPSGGGPKLAAPFHSIHNHNQKYDSLLVIYYTFTDPPEGMVPNFEPKIDLKKN